jgi:hypothetical protein
MMESIFKTKRTSTMETQNTQPLKETMNDSFFFRKSIIGDILSNNDKQPGIQDLNTINTDTSNLLIPVNLVTEPGEVAKDIVQTNKNSFMKTFIRKSGVFAIAFVIANLFFVSNAFGQYPVVAGTATSNAGGNATTHTVSLPSGVEVGDLLIVIMGFRDRNFTATTVSFPAGWTELVTRTVTTGQGVVYYKVATVTEAGAASISVSTGSVDARRGSIVYRIRKDTYLGTPQASFINTTSLVSSTNPNPPSLTPSWGSAKNLWIAGAAGYRAGTDPNTGTFIPASFSNGIYSFDNSSNTNSSGSASSATREFEGTTLDPGNFALTTTNHRAFTIAIQGATPATITTGAISGSPFCVTASLGAAVSVPFTSIGTYTSNTYTAQLSNAAGSFASPIFLGSLVSTANSGSIPATIPANTATGTGYRIRVISNSPVVTGTDNGSNLAINLSTNSIAPTGAQLLAIGANGNQLTVTESAGFLSREWFWGPTSGDPLVNATGVTTTTFTPNFATQGPHFVVCVSTYACGTVTSNQVQVNVFPTITTGVPGGSPFCITTTVGASISVPFTSVGTYTSNTYTVQLSNAAGSFSSPVNIGTLTSNDNSGSIDCIIPFNTPSGTNYQVKVVSNGPTSISQESAIFEINLANVTINPPAIQNIGVAVNGTTLTVTETAPVVSREWYVGTTDGGPYDPTGNTTTTFTPNFSPQGTYYIVCITTFACGIITSNQVQVNALPNIATDPVSGSPFCITPTAGAPVLVSFTSSGVFSIDNIYTAQLSNAVGSFASPVDIGNIQSNANIGTISANIPANTASGTGYRIRVMSSNPVGAATNNGSDLIINLAAANVSPSITQNISVGANGNQLTVTESAGATSREWFVGTATGGPYDPTGNITTTFTPNFGVAGTYYIVCVSTFACGTATSNQIQVNVTASITTGTITSPLCA